MIYYQQGNATIHNGDCLEVLRTLPDESVHCCVTSPPYWGLRDYGHDGQIGLEETPEAYVSRLVEVFREVRRVLRSDGTLWLNLGDSYANTTSGTGCRGGSFASERSQWKGETEKRDIPEGLKPKDLVGIPWRVAFALQADGWWLRQDIIWHKPNPMPESVRDRCTKAHEYVFLLAKSERYYYDAEAVAEAASEFAKTPNRPRVDPAVRKGIADALLDGVSWCGVNASRNRRSVWTVSTKPYAGAHFATMPPDLVEPCIMAGCPDRCCPACGAGYERMTKRVGEYTTQWGSNVNLEKQSSYPNGMRKTNQSRKEKMTVGIHETLGWQPACDCAASGTIPGTVLDPFNGAATVGLVSLQLQRRYIGIELNPEYCKISVDRINMEARQKRLFAASCDS